MIMYAILKESRYIKEDGVLDNTSLDYEFYDELFADKDKCFAMMTLLYENLKKKTDSSTECDIKIDKERCVVECILKFKRKEGVLGYQFINKVVEVKIYN